MTQAWRSSSNPAREAPAVENVSLLDQSPFTREELERYRARISKDMLNENEEAVFSQEHYAVYQEILDRLPTCK